MNGVGPVAVKLLPLTSSTRADFFREIGTLRRVEQCRSALQFYGWLEVRDPTGRNLVGMITERCVRSLSDAVRDDNFDPEILTWVRYLRQVAEGMAHLAREGIIHRDLKPENVLLTSADSVAISDFGLAVTKTTIMRTSTSSSSKLGAGTVGYMAPEARTGF